VQEFVYEAERHALEFPTVETCGLVVHGKYYRCRNISPDPSENFILQPKDYLKAALKGSIEYVVHSHPKGGEASAEDHKACGCMKIPWYIYLVPQKQWISINP
tara:strand:- start:176 stop:484 length:309 start_codon:yes stop_codon:yes gene_type:complete